MPTYTYKCKTNGHVFDKRQKFTDDPLTACIECGEPVRKVINSVGVVFKGKGFYVTDNRSTNSAAPKTSSSGDNSASKKSDGGGDSAKASSSDAKSEKAPAKASSAET